MRPPRQQVSDLLAGRSDFSGNSVHWRPTTAISASCDVMRVFRRLLRIFIIVLLLALASGGVMYHLSTRTPAAYARRLLSGEERDAAAQRLETEKIPQILNMATEAQSKASSAYRAQSRGQAIPPDATQPTAPVTVSFSEDEINASLGKWSVRYGTGIER